MPTDSSHSRNYLTPTNNPYSSIHQISNDPDVLAERQRRNQQLISHKSDALKKRISSFLSTPPARLPSSSLPEHRTLHLDHSQPAMNILDDDDINRPPESSDEENAQSEPPESLSDKELRSSKKRKLPAKSPLHTRDINTDSTRKSKRHKGSDDSRPASTMPEKPSKPVAEDEEPHWLSQESKVRKNKQKYRSSQNSNSITSSATVTRPDNAKFKPVSREITPVAETRRSRRSEPKLKEISSSPSIAPSSNLRPAANLIDVSPDESKPDPIARAVFQAIEDPYSDEEPTSRTTSDSFKSAIFDKAKVKHDRRGSSSSLSSVDSLVEYQLDTSQKAALMSDKNDLKSNDPLSAINLPPNHIVCPCCRRPTSLQNIPGHNSNTKPSSLTLREQTKFCYNHRIRDAQITWKERHYPTIDWDTLPQSPSLKSHIKSLVPLVRRKSPSHYLSTLDTAISAARGNQTEINRIFDVANVHHGYYGPRGAKIISNAIMEDSDLQKVLSRQLRNDKTMRIAGLGRLTDCVLLPEVLVRMVQEDLVLGVREAAGEQARKVLEDSVEIGLLLCADDDEVDGGEEDDAGDIDEL